MICTPSALGQKLNCFLLILHGILYWYVADSAGNTKSSFLPLITVDMI